MAEETILLSKLTGPNDLPNHKVITLKRLNTLNQKKHHSVVSPEKEKANIQLEIEQYKQQLSALKEQKDKMLLDIKNAINEEKAEWQETKKIEQEKAEKIGYKVGYDAGEEKALTEYEKLLTEANQIVENATKDYHRTIEKHEEAIAQLAITVAAKIIDDKIAGDNSYFINIVKKAIEELKDTSNISIYLHPQDYEFVSKQKEELEQLVEDDEIISIYCDQHLNKGDCVIKHPFGQIDTGIDTQLQQIKRALEEKITEN